MKKVIFICISLNWLNLSGQVLITDCNVENTPQILNYEQVKKYVMNYDLLYRQNTQKKENHTKVYYINSKSILFLDDFFKYNKYLGVNIYLVSYRGLKAKGQKRSIQNLPYLVPVHEMFYGTNKKDTVAEYGVLKAFYNLLPQNTYSADSLNKGIACNGKCDDSLRSWTGSKPLRDFKDLPGDVNSSDIFLLTEDKTTHMGNRKNYIADHNECGGNQTKWAFMDTNTIKRLASFIRYRENINKFPLIGIYYGVYNESDQRRRKHKDQTMLMLVPLRKMDDNNFIPDPCSYAEHNRIYKNSFGENHGELCPYDCPGGEIKQKIIKDVSCSSPYLLRDCCFTNQYNLLV